MKLIVKNTFRDKKDLATVYPVGTTLEINDAERCADLIKRGLCEAVKDAMDEKTSKDVVDEKPAVAAVESETPEKESADGEKTSKDVVDEKPAVASPKPKQEKKK